MQVSDAGPGEGGVQADCGVLGPIAGGGCCREQDQAGSRGSTLEVSWEIEIRGRMIAVVYLGSKMTW